MKYDDASWHSGGDFPDDLPPEAGGTHIAMFLAWSLLNTLSGELHMEELANEFNQLITRQVTPSQYFFRNCDGKLTDEDLSDEGNAFARFYFDSDKGKYLTDYTNLLARNTKTVYNVKDTWENFDRIGTKIRQRFDHWKSTKD
ncbi:MAG: hypothetical protein AAGC44_12475 [Planctomycetota bacterium]